MRVATSCNYNVFNHDTHFNVHYVTTYLWHDQRSCKMFFFVTKNVYDYFRGVSVINLKLERLIYH